MLNIMTNPADQIDVGDIEELITSQIPESQQLEFKGSLPSGGKKHDPWYDGQKEIGDKARNELLAETVAFANAQGGTLLVGIEESSDNIKPETAAKITPLPECAELAVRLGMKFRDCIEPQIPQLEVFGVPVEGNSGVVVIRVGRSRLAPHRVTPTKVCSIRRADRCEPMTMWEIQDMTLNVSRGMERFEKRLQERSDRFQHELNRLITPHESYGIRLTALPVGEEIQFERVYHQQNIRPDLSIAWNDIHQTNNRKTLNLPLGFPPNYWRPILRGVRGERWSDLPSAFGTSCKVRLL